MRTKRRGARRSARTPPPPQPRWPCSSTTACGSTALCARSDRASKSGSDGEVLDVVADGGDRWLWSGHVAGERVAIGLERAPHALVMSWRGVEARVRVRSPRVADLTELMPESALADGGKVVRCPMPGLVVSLAVAAGDQVEDGQPLAVIEAMKMENVIRAERSGKVKAVHVGEGASLAVDAVILEFE